MKRQSYAGRGPSVHKAPGRSGQCLRNQPKLQQRATASPGPKGLFIFLALSARLNRLLKKAEDEENPTKRSPSVAKAALKLVGLNVRAEARTLHEMHFSASCEVVPWYKTFIQPAISSRCYSQNSDLSRWRRELNPAYCRRCRPMSRARLRNTQTMKATATNAGTSKSNLKSK
jgi:hypothetical protein